MVASRRPLQERVGVYWRAGEKCCGARWAEVCACMALTRLNTLVRGGVLVSTELTRILISEHV